MLLVGATGRAGHPPPQGPRSQLVETTCILWHEVSRLERVWKLPVPSHHARGKKTGEGVLSGRGSGGTGVDGKEELGKLPAAMCNRELDPHLWWWRAVFAHVGLARSLHVDWDANLHVSCRWRELRVACMCGCHLQPCSLCERLTL